MVLPAKIEAVRSEGERRRDSGDSDFDKATERFSLCIHERSKDLGSTKMVNNRRSGARTAYRQPTPINVMHGASSANVIIVAEESNCF